MKKAYIFLPLLASIFCTVVIAGLFDYENIEIQIPILIVVFLLIFVGIFAGMWTREKLWGHW